MLKKNILKIQKSENWNIIKQKGIKTMWIIATVKKCIGILKKIHHKIMFKIKLREMDNWWEYLGCNCWQLFPPSFYYTHTEKEIEQITEETIESYKKMLDKF